MSRHQKQARQISSIGTENSTFKALKYGMLRMLSSILMPVRVGGERQEITLIIFRSFGPRTQVQISQPLYHPLLNRNLLKGQVVDVFIMSFIFGIRHVRTFGRDISRLQLAPVSDAPLLYGLLIHWHMPQNIIKTVLDLLRYPRMIPKP